MLLRVNQFHFNPDLGRILLISVPNYFSQPGTFASNQLPSPWAMGDSIASKRLLAQRLLLKPLFFGCHSEKRLVYKPSLAFGWSLLRLLPDAVQTSARRRTVVTLMSINPHSRGELQWHYSISGRIAAQKKLTQSF